MGGQGINYFKDDGLIGLMTSGDKFIQNLAHWTIKDILESGIYFEHIPYLLMPLANNPNA